MLHLQKHLLPFSRHQWLVTLTRSASVAASPGPAQFAVADYLTASCHLTRDQALRASQKLSHLKSPSNPDAVLAVLSDFGLTPRDIATAVVRHPKLLCCKADKTLAPRLAALKDHGLSASQIARFVAQNPTGFCRPAVVSKLQYYVPLFGSFENLLKALRRNGSILASDLEQVVKPNVAFLMECGLYASDIAKLSLASPRLINTNLKRVRVMVERAEAVGVPRGTAMFWQALLAVAFLSEEKIAAKVVFLKKSFRWSDAEVGVAVSRFPMLLKHSKEKLHRMMEFLITQVGLEPEYIAHRPFLLSYSLEHRLAPRHYVVKFLKENRLLEQDRSYYTAAQVSEKVFVEKFICPFKEAAPHLAEDYAAACRGEVPSRFRL